MHVLNIIEKNFKIISLCAVFLCVPVFTVLIMTGRCEGLYLFIAICLGVLLLISFAVSGKSRNISSGLLTLSAFLIAVFIRCVPQYYNGTVNADRLIEELCGREHTFEGITVTEDVYTSDGMFVKIVSVDGKKLKAPVTAYGFNSSGHFIAENTGVVFQAKLRAPQKFKDSRFDIAGWLAGKGIYCEIYDVYEFEAIGEESGLSVGASLREAVKSKVADVLECIPGKERFERSVALCRALLFGDKSGFEPDDLDAFSKSGMTHLLCVSGLHFSVVMGYLSLLMGLIIPDRRWKTVILAMVSTLYLCMCGFSKSALRAAVMAFISSAGVVYGKRHGCTHTLLLAVVLICIADPGAVFDTSFRLSVLSCAGIACSGLVNDILSEKLQFRPILNYAVGTAVMSASCFAFTFAYSACAFGGFSTVSVFSSVFAVLPSQVCMMLAWLSVPVAVMEIPVLSFACADIIMHLSEFIYNTAYYFSGLKYSYIVTDVPDLSFAVFMAMMCLISFVTASKSGGAKIYFYVSLLSVISVILMLCSAFQTN